MSEKEHLETSNEGIQDIKNLINSGNSIDAEVKIKTHIFKNKLIYIGIGLVFIAGLVSIIY